jgi:hypothetical protein
MRDRFAAAMPLAFVREIRRLSRIACPVLVRRGHLSGQSSGAHRSNDAVVVDRENAQNAR